MNYTGKMVRHKKFGRGKIVSSDGKYVQVRFESGESKAFVYPMCFESFLMLEDRDAADAARVAIKTRETSETIRMDTVKTNQANQRSNRTYSVVDSSVTSGIQYSGIAHFFDRYQSALTQEIRYLQEKGGKHEKVHDGMLIDASMGRFTYSFESDVELSYPEGTDLKLWGRFENMHAVVKSCEEFTMILVTLRSLGQTVAELEFSAESWRLMLSLKNRMVTYQQAPPKIMRQLVMDGPASVDYRKRNIITGQDNAIKMANDQPITFIWGPPGTGKTYTLAKIAIDHMKRGNKVLMLSYSNVSVDGAINRVYQMMIEEKETNVKPGHLIRYGYPKDMALKEHPFLTSYNYVIQGYPGLLKRRKELEERKRHGVNDSKELLRIENELINIRKSLKSKEKLSVQNAKFVATTISKAVVDEVVYDGDFDVVIFDEASMALVPQIAFAAGLAKKNFICMGDFNQLPPIVQSNSDSYLADDIFQVCGITEAVWKGVNHKWLCMLDTQYRMYPDIADFVSKTMYRNLLKSAPQMQSERQEIVDDDPLPRSPIVFADVSGMMSVCMKTNDNSRYNLLSALITFALALKAAETHEVGVITPYFAQSRLLHAMAAQAEKTGMVPNKIVCATVHQFQGSEKDVIIYDAVDCYRQTHPGILLTSTKNNYANRLYNVAMTRARGKFVNVANIDYMENKNISSNHMFGQMIQKMKRSDDRIHGEELMDNILMGTDPWLHFYESDEAKDALLEDIRKAKNSIRIDIPGKLVENSALRVFVAALENAIKRGVKLRIRTEDKTLLPAIIRKYAAAIPFIANPVTMIDKKITWYGEPLSAADFISEGRVIPTNHRPIIRVEGAKIAAAIYGYLEMDRDTDQSKAADVNEKGELITDNFTNYVLQHKTCPNCGQPMKLAKSKRNKPYLACTSGSICKYYEYIDVDFVNKYFYRHRGTGQPCTKCGSTMEAVIGQYGLWIRCCGEDHHTFKLFEV